MNITVQAVSARAGRARATRRDINTDDSDHVDDDDGGGQAAAAAVAKDNNRITLLMNWSVCLILHCHCLLLLLSIITLRAKLSGAVYCYRSCLFATGGRSMCGFVDLLPR